MDLHVCYLARVLDAVVSRLNASVFFLPHSLEPGERNDVSTAQAVSGRMQTPAEHRHVLAEELTARRLKGIVSRCDLLVGQRAHSLIGSASCETPFVALITSNDRRTHEILGDVFGCERQLVDIDRTPEEEAASRIAEIAGDATAIRQALQRRMAQCREELARVAAMVRGTRR
jgi:polysaccharide pyruvyl transferase WcaK-like protein